MDLRAKIALGVSAVVVGGLVAVAVPALSATVDVVHTTVQGVGHLTRSSTPSPTPSSQAGDAEQAAAAGVPDGYVALGDGSWIPEGGPGDCPTTAVISIVDGIPALRGGEVTDMGARDGARGDVVADGAGIRSYIVAPNDNLIAIGERLCVSYPTLMSFNHVLGVAIQPGQELILRPDPAIPWIDPYEPFDAVPGTSTVAYNTAIYEMGTFVRNRDLGAARLLWTRLAPDISPEAASVAVRALEDGDWYVLGHLFP